MTIFEKNLIHIQNVLLIKGCLKVRTEMSVTPIREELLLGIKKELHSVRCGIGKKIEAMCSDILFGKSYVSHMMHVNENEKRLFCI